MSLNLALEIGKFLYKKWNEKQKEIQKNIDEYLSAAAKDKMITNVDAVFLKPRILDLIRCSLNIDKLLEKDDLFQLTEVCKEYIRLIDEVESKLPFDHLLNILSLSKNFEIPGIGKFSNTNASLEKTITYLTLIFKTLTIYDDVNEDEEFDDEFIEFTKTIISYGNNILRWLDNNKDFTELCSYIDGIIEYSKGRLYYCKGYLLRNDYKDLSSLNYFLIGKEYFKSSLLKLKGDIKGLAEKINLWNDYEISRNYVKLWKIKSNYLLRDIRQSPFSNNNDIDNAKRLSDNDIEIDEEIPDDLEFRNINDLLKLEKDLEFEEIK